MSDSEFDFLQGEISAINTVLTQIISAMHPQAAAVAALGLAQEIQLDQEPGNLDETPEGELKTRSNLLKNYLGLLQAVAKNG